MGSCTWRFGRLFGGISYVTVHCPETSLYAYASSPLHPLQEEERSLAENNNKWLNSLNSVHLRIFCCCCCCCCLLCFCFVVVVVVLGGGLCLRSVGCVSVDVASVHKKESPLCVRMLCSLAWQNEVFAANIEQVPG